MIIRLRQPRHAAQTPPAPFFTGRFLTKNTEKEKITKGRTARKRWLDTVFARYYYVSKYSGGIYAAQEFLMVGTWVDGNGKTWVFNANGTGKNGSGYDLSYVAVDTKLAIHMMGDTCIYNMIKSSDGRTDLLENNGSNDH
jgi:hypothetical protein